MNKEDVLKIISSMDLDFMSPIEIINVKSISRCLGLSMYMTRKLIKELVKEGLIELKMKTFCSEYSYEGEYYSEEVLPPYWGYGITDKGRKSQVYLNEKKRINRVIGDVFGKEYMIGEE